MKYLKTFESQSNDIINILTKDIFVELIDDSILTISEDIENPIVAQVDFPAKEPGESYSIQDLVNSTSSKLAIFKRLNVAFRKLDGIGVSYQITEMDEEGGYMLISLFYKDFDAEYFSISGNTIIIKKDKIQKDYGCSVGLSTSGKGHWIVLGFKGNNTQVDEIAQEFLNKMKKFSYNGKPLIKALETSYGGFYEDGDVKHDDSHPFGIYYSKDKRQYAEVQKREHGERYNKKIDYSFGINDEFNIDW